jgi:hypothetical protein
MDTHEDVMQETSYLHNRNRVAMGLVLSGNVLLNVLSCYGQIAYMPSFKVGLHWA